MPVVNNVNGKRSHWTMDENNKPKKVVDPVRNKKIDVLSLEYVQEFEAKNGLGIG